MRSSCDEYRVRTKPVTPSPCRELPASTGVIDLKTFLRALVDIGYDGPVRPEPFNRTLNGMSDALAVAAAAEAMREAFALVE